MCVINLSLHPQNTQSHFQISLKPSNCTVRYNLYAQKLPDHEAVGRLLLKQLRDKKLKFYVACETSTEGEGIPQSQIDDVHRLLFDGDALRLNSSEVSN